MDAVDSSVALGRQLPGRKQQSRQAAEAEAALLPDVVIPSLRAVQGGRTVPQIVVEGAAEPSPSPRRFNSDASSLHVSSLTGARSMELPTGRSRDEVVGCGTSVADGATVGPSVLPVAIVSNDEEEYVATPTSSQSCDVRRTPSRARHHSASTPPIPARHASSSHFQRHVASLVVATSDGGAASPRALSPRLTAPPPPRSSSRNSVTSLTPGRRSITPSLPLRDLEREVVTANGSFAVAVVPELVTAADDDVQRSEPARSPIRSPLPPASQRRQLSPAQDVTQPVPSADVSVILPIPDEGVLEASPPPSQHNRIVKDQPALETQSSAPQELLAAAPVATTTTTTTTGLVPSAASGSHRPHVSSIALIADRQRGVAAPPPVKSDPPNSSAARGSSLRTAPHIPSPLPAAPLPRDRFGAHASRVPIQTTASAALPPPRDGAATYSNVASHDGNLLLRKAPVELVSHFVTVAQSVPEPQHVKCSGSSSGGGGETSKGPLRRPIRTPLSRNRIITRDVVSVVSTGLQTPPFCGDTSEGICDGQGAVVPPSLSLPSAIRDECVVSSSPKVSVLPLQSPSRSTTSPSVSSLSPQLVTVASVRDPLKITAPSSLPPRDPILCAAWTTTRTTTLVNNI